MSVIDLLDQLEGLVVSGRRVPFTPSVLLNEDEALDLIDQARTYLPEEMKQARWTVEEQSRILAEAADEASAMRASAQQEAERIHSAAVERAQQLVSESEVLRAARERAEALLHEAQAAAAATRQEADRYARGLMERLETQLGQMAATVRQGIETLQGEAHPVEATPSGGAREMRGSISRRRGAAAR